jgi:hypothetical protein
LTSLNADCDLGQLGFVRDNPDGVEGKVNALANPEKPDKRKTEFVGRPQAFIRIMLWVSLVFVA